MWRSVLRRSLVIRFMNSTSLSSSKNMCLCSCHRPQLHFSTVSFTSGTLNGHPSAAVTPSQTGAALETLDEQRRILAVQLLDEIQEMLKQNGVNVIFRKTQPTDPNVTRLPTYVLLKHGIPEHLIIDVFILCTQLLQVDAAALDKCVNELLDYYGFKPERLLGVLLIVGPDYINSGKLSKNLHMVYETLGRWGLSTPAVTHMIQQEPKVATIKLKQIENVNEALRGMFHERSRVKIYSSYPNTLLCEPEDLIEKYNYLNYDMRVEREDLEDCSWPMQNLNYIRMRHEFLQRTGAYIFPSLKKPVLSKDNPSLKNILESSDIKFAYIAGVTYPEYQVFKKMYKRELEEEAKQKLIQLDEFDNIIEDNDDDEADNKEIELLDSGAHFMGAVTPKSPPKFPTFR